MNADRIYLGWDFREQLAYQVAQHSIQMRSRRHDIRPLKLAELQRHDLSTRLYSERDGQLWDEMSGAPCATQFANTRFLVPKLAQHGWALFMDSDIVVLADIGGLFNLADPRYAVMCVKHAPLLPFSLAPSLKMDGKLQTYYHRKNWSSVMLMNCDHPAWNRLTLKAANSRPGRDLHAFYWLEEEEIGALPPAWNWLVNAQPMPTAPKLAHFTLGGPWLPGWKGAEHDEIWLAAEKDFRSGR